MLVFVVVIAILAIILFLLTLRLIYVLQIVYQRRRHLDFDSEARRKTHTVKTMVIMGSGGHTAEMIRVLSGLRCHVYFPREYVVADTDTMSVKKVGTFELQHASETSEYKIHKIPRSREVGQTWLSTVFTTFYACLHALWLVGRVCPQLVLCNGPGTCIPLCGAAFLIKVLGFYDIKIVYVESICRVKSLSLSGKILYWFADHVLVQWPQLTACYPLTKYIGRIS